jgi:hypothetical protein
MFLNLSVGNLCRASLVPQVRLPYCCTLHSAWMLLTWVLPLIRLARTRELGQDDIPQVGTGVSAWHRRFKRIWRAQRARGKPASATRALVQTFWPTLVGVALLKMVADAIVFVPPLLLKEITKVRLLCYRDNFRLKFPLPSGCFAFIAFPSETHT